MTFINFYEVIVDNLFVDSPINCLFVRFRHVRRAEQNWYELVLDELNRSWMILTELA